MNELTLEKKAAKIIKCMSYASLGLMISWVLLSNLSVGINSNLISNLACVILLAVPLVLSVFFTINFIKNKNKIWIFSLLLFFMQIGLLAFKALIWFLNRY